MSKPIKPSTEIKQAVKKAGCYLCCDARANINACLTCTAGGCGGCSAGAVVLPMLKGKA